MGAMGQKHYHAIQPFEGINIAAVVDPLGFKESSCPVYSTVEELLGKEKIDCAIICTPTILHLKTAIPFIRKGVHILIEKPIVCNMNQAQELEKISSESKSKIAVGYVERFNPAIQCLMKNIEEEIILKCSIIRVGPQPIRFKDVGVRLDLAVHDVDLIKFIMGATVEKSYYSDISVMNKREKSNIILEDNTTIFMKMNNGASATINSSWTYPFRERTLKILTDKFYYDVDMLNLSVDRYQSLDNNRYIKESLLVKKEDALKNQFKSFLGYAIMNRIGDIATLSDGIESLRIVSEEIK